MINYQGICTNTNF